MTPCFNARIGAVGVAAASATKTRLFALLLGQRTEAFDDFAIRLGECENPRDLRMPHGMSET